MIYWVFFLAGAGGDGFANLLEHADNIEPWDGDNSWRTVLVNNNKVKFESKRWVKPSNWFKAPWAHEDFHAELTPEFIESYNKGNNMVISGHNRHYSANMPNFPFKHLFTAENQKFIYLYSDDVERLVSDVTDKVTQPWVPVDDKFIEEYRPFIVDWNKRLHNPNHQMHQHSDAIIDIDRAWTDWDYLNDKLQDIGIFLQRKYYEEYLDVSKRRRQ